MVFVSIQAVSLYKDPKGEKVLDTETIPTIAIQIHSNTKKAPTSFQANIVENSDPNIVLTLQERITKPEATTESHICEGKFNFV